MVFTKDDEDYVGQKGSELIIYEITRRNMNPVGKSYKKKS